MSNLPQVGDVIKSPKFAYGYWESEDKEIITIDGQSTSYVVGYTVSVEERLKAAAVTGNPDQPLVREVDLGAYDPSRGNAEFIVEKASMEGGGTGMGPHDVYPDGWLINARRLSKAGVYDPDGEVIRFYMSGSFTCMVLPVDVAIVRHMKMSFK
ncbi:MAG: hypothetical protein HYV90_01005 [Candidatus Woesebacteria bacterium]|nr:MAG: hypothetical protein HYV90_01005 [Candidatus Woesebacteria bacterium]